MSYDAPFASLKVVDISQGIAGPYAGMLMAQHGAEVIKVEPLGGDWARTLGERYGDHTAFSIAGNLGKRGVAVDLKSEEGRAIVHRLIKDADVFIEGFRPGVTARLGFGYDVVSKENPGIIYLAVSGFGQSGPLAERPGMDPVLQAFTGLIDANKGIDGTPHRVPIIPVDMATALYGFHALSVALYAKRDEAKGRYIDANLLQAGAALQVVRMMATYMEGGEMRPGVTPAGVFPTADGWIILLTLRDSQFPTLCDALEVPDLKQDSRFADNDLRFQNEAALTELLNAALAKRTSDEWSKRLTAAGLLHEKVNDFRDFLKHPHVDAIGAIAWLDQPGVEGKVPVPNAPGLAPLLNRTPRALSPTLGQHSGEVLRELGYSPSDIAGLVSRGIINGHAEG